MLKPVRLSLARSAPAAALAVALASLVAASPAAAGEALACPPLATAIQVDACPAEEQLQTGYTGFCSDNRRLYASDHDTCARFENYRKLKNVALWEAGPDGAFQGYLSCDLPPARLAHAALRSVTVTRQGTVTRVACRYDEDLTLALRTKARCAVKPDPRCTADAAHCRVHCE